MRIKEPFFERQLAALAKQFREAAGKSKSQAARELGISPPSVFNAEERPELSLTSLRIRLIQAYSPYRVVGPLYRMEKK